MNNPFLGSLKNVYSYLMVWAVIMVAHTIIIYSYYKILFIPALADALTFNSIFAALGLGIWYTIRFLRLGNQSLSSFLTNHLIVMITCISVWFLSSLFTIKIITEGDTVYLDFLYKSLPLRIATGLLYYFILVMIYYLYIYYISLKEKLIKEATLRTLVKETELSLLKSQINPHFIFNSLNSISALTITNPPLAQEMIVKLSAFLRYALEQNSRHLIRFQEELENTGLYLEIEKTRFGEKLIYEKDIQEGLQSCMIPNLILQPLIENAVKHGVYESTEKVTIRLTARRENQFLSISVKNNFDPDAAVRRGKGIGLKNVKERLFLIYGHRELVLVQSGEGIFEVKLFIPQEHDNTTA